jgi:hypothetical protein
MHDNRRYNGEKNVERQNRRDWLNKGSILRMAIQADMVALPVSYLGI